MSDWDRLAGRLFEIAKEEGLVEGREKPTREILPKSPDVSPDAAKRVMSRFLGEGLSPEALHDEILPEAPDVTPDTTKRSHSAEEPDPSEVTPEDMSDDLDAEPANSADARSSEVQDLIRKTDDIVQEQLNILEEWAKFNLGAARKDWWRFWALKIPALGSSVSVTAFEAFNYGNVVIMLGVVTALCVGIDAAFPGGQLHNVHKRAANEARRLQNDVLLRWRKVQVDRPDARVKAIQGILDEIQEERARIDKYVTDAEASLGKERSTSS